MAIDGNALGKALAFHGGDLRDWPTQCAWPDCRSEDIGPSVPGRLTCRSRGRHTSEEVAYADRVARAQREVGDPKLVFAGAGIIDAPA